MQLPWLIDSDSNGTFTHVHKLDEQPFAYKENLVYLLPTDIYFETEVLQALLERRYIAEDDLRGSRHATITSTETSRGRMMGVLVKTHIDSKT